MRSRKLYKKEWVEWAIKNGINLTKEGVEAAVQKHNDMMSQSVPWNNGARLKPNKMEKITLLEKPWKTQATRIKSLAQQTKEQRATERMERIMLVCEIFGGVAFIVGIYCLVLLGLSF